MKGETPPLARGPRWALFFALGLTFRPVNEVCKTTDHFILQFLCLALKPCSMGTFEASKNQKIFCSNFRGYLVLANCMIFHENDNWLDCDLRSFVLYFNFVKPSHFQEYLLVKEIRSYCEEKIVFLVPS